MAFFQEHKLILNSIETDRKRPISDYLRSAWEKILENYQLYSLFLIPVAFIGGSMISPVVGLVFGVSAYALVFVLLATQSWIFKIKTAGAFGLIHAEQYLHDGQLDETIEGVIEKAIPLENDPTVHTQFLYSYFESLRQTSDITYSSGTNSKETNSKDLADKSSNLDFDLEMDPKELPFDLREPYQRIIENYKKRRAAFKATESTERLDKVDLWVKSIQLSKYDVWFVKFRRMYYLDDFPYRFMFVCLPKGTKSIDDVWIKTRRQLFIEGVFGEGQAYIPNLLLVGEWWGSPIYVTVFTQDELYEFIKDVHRPPIKNKFDWTDVRNATALIETNFAYGENLRANSLENRLKEQKVLTSRMVEEGTDVARDILLKQSMLEQDAPPPDHYWRNMLIIAGLILFWCFAYYSCAYDWIGMPELLGPFKRSTSPSGSPQDQESVPVEGNIGRILYSLLNVLIGW